MSAIALRLVIAIVHVWTRVITHGLPPSVRDRRREEIASDLWEFHQDSKRGGALVSAFRVLARLVFGIPDDVLWRLKQQSLRPLAVRFGVALAMLAIMAVVFVNQALQPQGLPAVNPAPPPEILRLRARTPPVPPPPPPLKRPGVPDPDWASLLMRIRETRRQTLDEPAR